MPIVEAEEEVRRDLGKFLYEVLQVKLGKLPGGEQLSLGFALQKGAPFETLGVAVRRAFAEAAKDLEL